MLDESGVLGSAHPLRSSASTLARSPCSNASTARRRPGNTRLQYGGRGRRQRSVLPFAQLEPVDMVFQHPPHHVLLHAVAPIGAQLVVQTDRGADGGDLDDQLRGTVEVIIGADAGAVARGRNNTQQGVGLRLVVQVKPHRGVVSRPPPRRLRAVGHQPAENRCVRLCMTGQAYRCRHMDDPSINSAFLRSGRAA